MDNSLIDNLSFRDFEQLLSLQQILDNIDAGIAVYDENGNYVFVNTYLIKWRNISRQEFLKMNVHDFMDVLDVCVFDQVCQTKTKMSRLQYYRNVQSPDAPSRTRIVTNTPIFDDHGNIKYVISLLQDVQDFVDLHQKLIDEQQTNVRKELIVEEHVDLIAESEEFRQLLTIADSVAKLDSTILLYGESGTGKEVVADFIHRHSLRSKSPMITVNCATFPENLIESELFGYEKGSFTGAVQSKAGLIESANGKTLFLDEINSLPLSVQGKLLRVIEEKSVRRIGALKPRQVDFRLIAATNQDLGKLVQEGKFRGDLYYRLHVIPLTLPPLRSRKDDIEPLCEYYLQYFGRKYHLRKQLAPEVIEKLKAYPWPGNVRELRNFIERIVVMTPYDTNYIYRIPNGILDEQEDLAAEKPSAAALPSAPVAGGSAEISDGSAHRKISRVDRESVIRALSDNPDSRQKAADALGISRRYLQYKIREYRISPRCKYENEV